MLSTKDIQIGSDEHGHTVATIPLTYGRIRALQRAVIRETVCTLELALTDGDNDRVENGFVEDADLLIRLHHHLFGAILALEDADRGVNIA